MYGVRWAFWVPYWMRSLSVWRFDSLLWITKLSGYGVQRSTYRPVTSEPRVRIPLAAPNSLWAKRYDRLEVSSDTRVSPSHNKLANIPFRRGIWRGSQESFFKYMGEYSVSGSRAVCKIVAIAARVVRLHLPPSILTIKEIRVRIPRTQQAA